ncbi:MAG: hypothetical protein ACRDPC_13195 [Solirubrobacteraceae bacterium]
MTTNRMVALLTPLLFAPLAGTISALAAKYVPGVDIPQSAIEEIFIAGALIAFAKAAQWTQGWQKFEARESQHEETAEMLDAREADVGAREAEFAVAGDEYDDYGDLLGADEDLDGDEDDYYDYEYDEPDAEPAER